MIIIIRIKMIIIIIILAEGPGVARENKFENFFFLKIAYNASRPPLSVPKKFQSNWSSRLAGYPQHIYIKCLVLLYRRFQRIQERSALLFLTPI